MQKLKTITSSLIIGITLASGITYAAATWNGTSWITDGSTISATSLKQNLDYLKEQIAEGGLWSKNGTNAYYNGGNVGVGTSAPGAKLDVTGGLTRVDKLRFKGVGGDSGQSNDWYSIYQESGAWVYPYPDLVIQNHTGIKYNAYRGYGGHQFFTGWNGTSITGLQMQITDKIYMAGNVGIGTTVPSAGLKLDVEGKVGATAYCDENGGNCKAAAQLGGGGASGYQIVTNTHTGNGHYSVNVSCNGSRKVVGGGCYQGVGSLANGGTSSIVSFRAIIENNPINDNGWHCATRSIDVYETRTTTVYAICMNVTP